ncbi:28S ribosomal protein S18b, mitochondrial-like [Centruroides sculpturatus]|uniref:28S ribosomal protein S18b, mitochondrial-like n=1 Tax=Centruroides sculpturatus TaxID=218467 RepID=UPI000C6E6877|nr:28S ribosomal protein S18b, mitochondrial-like [Centruroides sculpturatus]
MLRPIMLNIIRRLNCLSKDDLCIKVEKTFSANAAFAHRNNRKVVLLNHFRNCTTNEKDNDKSEAVDPSKDRSKVISPETSIRYLESKAYRDTYQDKPVWVPYRRNFKGTIAPRTRKTCIRADKISTGSPCPICRDEYLVLHHTNVKLLKQFICPYTGEIYPTDKTGLCQRQQKNLLIAIQMAKDYGNISFEVPFRRYDYEEFFSQTICS